MAILTRPTIESAHWYTGNGEPVHTRPSSEGTPRPTTLADARKLALFPSVTGILGIMAKHGLEKWKIKQVLLAMKKVRQKPKQADEDYFSEVVNTAFAQVDTAATAGSGVHGAVMCALQGRPFDSHFQIYIDRLFAFFERAKIEPRCTEQTIVNHEFGFAGTMDFAGIRNQAVPIVLDWKTRRTKPGRPIESYEGQPMQIAAYGATYWKHEWGKGVIGGNIYISSTEPGRIEMVPYDYTRMRKEFEAFKSCAEIWRHINGYDPRVAGSAVDEGGADIAQEKYHNVAIGFADLPEGTPLLTELIPKASDPAPAKTTVPTPAKRQDAGKAAKADLKLEAEPTITKPIKKEKEKPVKATPTPKPKATPLEAKNQSRRDAGKPELKGIPFGKFKGVEVHNVPVPELEKILKFSKHLLKEHPAVQHTIERFLDGQGRKAAKSHNVGKKK